MSTVLARWGNEASMEMFGYEKFVEGMYYPIETYRDTLNLVARFNAQDAMRNALKNKSFTKSTVQGASNAIEIGSIFDRFTEHAVDMANYASLAPAVETLRRVFNHRNGQTGTTARTELERTTGKAAWEYLEKLIADLNGNGKATGETSLDRKARSLVSHAKAASILFKLRVVIQQPTSIFRAMDEISGGYLAKGATQAMSHIKASIEEMQTHSPLAWWKDNGGYETHMGRNAKQTILNDQSIMSRVDSAGTKLAGMADNSTWASIWEAVKLETQATKPQLEVNSADYWDAVTERFNGIVERTQVVDTVLQRSQLARSSGWGGLFTAFMSEPLKTFNMGREAVVNLYRAISGHASKAEQKKALIRLARTGMAVASSALANALVVSIYDALRYRNPDDEEVLPALEAYYESDAQTFADRVIDNFLSGINPIEMLPGASELWDVMANASQGWSAGSNNMILDAIIDLSKSIATADKAVQDVREGELRYGSRSWYGIARDITNAVSRLTGLPAEGLLANAEALINSVVPGTLITTNPERYDRLKLAIYTGDSDEARAAVQVLQAEGVETKTIRQVLTSTFKPIYLDMYAKGDTAGMATLRDALQGYYEEGLDKFTEWLED